MPRLVLFTVYAPLGSWGSPSRPSATAAVKPTDLHPTRSALVGMLGAAMGWTRDRLPVLSASIDVGVRVDIVPTAQPRADFQTVTPADTSWIPEGRDKRDMRWSRFQEARAALQGGVKKGAILSRREYFAHGLWTVAIQVREGGAVSAEDLLSALRAPRFPLFVGRKAFGLGLPPSPEIVTAEDVVAAFAQRTPEMASEFWREHIMRDGDRPTKRASQQGVEDADVVSTVSRYSPPIMLLDEALLPAGFDRPTRRVSRWDMTEKAPADLPHARRFSARTQVEIAPCMAQVEA